MTAYQEFVARWKNCKECGLCDGRLKVVLARGQVPADVIFVGEAPGESENVIGRPFVGPAGKLLEDEIIGKVVAMQKLRWAMTNLVCCIPRDEDGNKTSEPDPIHIKACSNRLNQFIKLCDPKLVVCVGALAQRWVRQLTNPHRSWSTCNIVHPAYILRANVAQQGMAVRKAAVQLADAVELMSRPKTHQLDFVHRELTDDDIPF